MKKLEKLYGMKDPQQVKMRILWMAVKQLLAGTFGDTTQNRKVIQEFDDHWKVCEREESNIHAG